MRAGLSDPHILLLRAIRSLVGGDPWFAAWGAGDAAPTLAIEGFDTEPWASLTFTGMRHSLEVRLDGQCEEVEAAAGHLRTRMSDPDIMIPGHFLADMQIIETERFLPEDGRTSLCLRLEALTIEE